MTTPPSSPLYDRPSSPFSPPSSPPPKKHRRPFKIFPQNLAQELLFDDSSQNSTHFVSEDSCQSLPTGDCSDNEDGSSSSDSLTTAESSPSRSEASNNSDIGSIEQSFSDFSDWSEAEVSDEECDDYSDVPLFEGSEHLRGEAILDLLDNFLSNNNTKKSLGAEYKTFVKYLPKINTMPKSLHLMLKYLSGLSPEYIHSYHLYCSRCLLYVDSGDDPCLACNCTEFKKFYSFSIEAQIKYYFEKRNLADIIDKYRADRAQKAGDGMIRDICDGSEYIRVKRNAAKYDLTLMVNTDGVSISKSSNVSLWPIMYTILEVPPTLRSQFLIVCGAWCDSKKPPMFTLMRPFCDKLEEIHSSGGVLWTHPKTETQFQSKLETPFVCVDAPVRAGVQNIQEHNSKYACNTCEQKSKRLRLTVAEVRAKAAGDKTIRRKRAFLFCEEPALLRTDARMRAQGLEALERKKNVKGVLGPSVMKDVPGLDISTCVFAEYMHSVCIGTVKAFMTLWFCVPGPWNISEHQVDIDQFMSQIKPSSHIERLPRGVSSFQKYKANEFRAFLLFFSLIVLNGYMPDEYVEHWSLFVHAIYLLLKEEISQRDIEIATYAVRIFLRDVGTLYRKQDYVYNLHEAMHLPLYVQRSGPLWATSAFKFESYNGLLCKLIHGTKNQALELMNNLRIAQGVEILRQIVNEKVGKKNESKKAVELLSKCLSPTTVEDRRILHELDLNLSTPRYARARVKNEVFTSVLYTQEKKRNNYTVCFEKNLEKHYGEIQFFVPTGNLTSEGCVVRMFNIDQDRIFLHKKSRLHISHIIPVSLSESILLIQIDEIKFKVTRVGEYLCEMPNYFERNL